MPFFRSNPSQKGDTSQRIFPGYWNADAFPIAVRWVQGVEEYSENLIKSDEL